MGNERVMTDHEHEWKGYINESSSGVTPMASYLCSYPSCRQELSIEEVEAILNEHATLKRESEGEKERANRWFLRWEMAYDILDNTQRRQYDEELCALEDTQEKEVTDE